MLVIGILWTVFMVNWMLGDLFLEMKGSLVLSELDTLSTGTGSSSNCAPSTSGRLNSSTSISTTNLN